MDDPARADVGDKLHYYLVKWKTLPYEHGCDEIARIKRFYKFNTIDELHTKYVAKTGQVGAHEESRG